MNTDVASPNMRVQRLGVLIALVACTACHSRGNRAEVRAEILRLDAEWSQAAQKRDVDRVVSYWADDAVVLPPSSGAVVGKGAIRDFVVKSFQTPGFGISWKTTDVTVSESGDLAYATGTNRVTFRGADGREASVDGKAVTVWRRNPSGTWKCVVDIWNDAAPPSQ